MNCQLHAPVALPPVKECLVPNEYGLKKEKETLASAEKSNGDCQVRNTIIIPTELSWLQFTAKTFRKCEDVLCMQCRHSFNFREC